MARRPVLELQGLGRGFLLLDVGVGADPSNESDPQSYQA
jgi:hypothetical protein